MDRHTTLGIAGAIALTLAAAATAIGVNLGIMSDTGATQGPGTFQPTAAILSDATVPTQPVTVTVYVDEGGQPVDPSAPSTDAPPADTPSTSAADPSGAPVPAPIDVHGGSIAVDHGDDHATSTDHETSPDQTSTDQTSTDHQSPTIGSTGHEAGHDDDD
jgi:hypothetical protein